MLGTQPAPSDSVSVFKASRRWSLSVGRIFKRGMAIDYGHGAVKRVTFDSFPVPAGSWQEAYNKRMAKGNIVLAFGATCFTLSCA